MSTATPFIPESTSGAIDEFGWWKIQRQTAIILTAIIKNFFDHMNQTYKTYIPEISAIENKPNDTKTNVTMNFPYSQRKFPLITVGARSSKERKMYIGADNIVGYSTFRTSSGDTRFKSLIYAGAADVNIALIIVALSSDDRRRYADLLSACFTHFYRWQYWYHGPDDSWFGVVPTTTEIQFGQEREIQEPSSTNMLYVTDLTLNSYVEYNFTDVNAFSRIKNIDFSELNGPISSSS